MSRVAIPGRRPEKRQWNHALGAFGEEAAADYLRSTGYRILARNWRRRDGDPTGELDIVARRGVVLVGCEVKTRWGGSWTEPIDAVTADKAVRLRRLTTRWLAENRFGVGHRQAGLRSVRVDVIAVLRVQNRGLMLRHLPGVC